MTSSMVRLHVGLFGPPAVAGSPPGAARMTEPTVGV